MLPPLLSAALRHPDLVADHAANYVALVREELAVASQGVLARLIAGVVAAASALTALGLIGTAVMLGVLHGEFEWVLVAVPGAAVLLAAVSLWVAMRPSSFHGFDDLLTQLQADAQALRTATEPRDG